MVTFDPTEDPGVIMERAATEQMTLMAFFAANRDLGELGTEAQKLVYQEFPQKMVEGRQESVGVKAERIRTWSHVFCVTDSWRTFLSQDTFDYGKRANIVY
jgi:hypothetical protein